MMHDEAESQLRPYRDSLAVRMLPLTTAVDKKMLETLIQHTVVIDRASGSSNYHDMEIYVYMPI